MHVSRPNLLLPPPPPQHQPIHSSRLFLTRKSSLSQHSHLRATHDFSLVTAVDRNPPADRPLSARWDEIHGLSDWAGLLDPMDPLLRSELIRYGEMAQACYDAFDYDASSRYRGSCKHGRRDFFRGLRLPDPGYEVTRYLYATASLSIPNFFALSRCSGRAWSERANWIGFVAVSTDEATALLGRRDILVAWRGTVTRLEWIADLMDYLRPVAAAGIPCKVPGVKVESGFLEIYTGKEAGGCRFCRWSAREQVVDEVGKQVEAWRRAGEKVSVTMTGHSLGSALAMLSAYDMAETGASGGAHVCVFSFCGPRVGNGAWKARFEAGVKALRVVNVHDGVPKLPGILVNERGGALSSLLDSLALPWVYSHVGVPLALDHKRSPFLKDSRDPAAFHNLEALLHLLDGYHGQGKQFVLASGRDPALVNKASDFLEENQLVPPFWRQDENKGLIQTTDGQWVQPDRPHIEDPYHDTPHHLHRLDLLRDRSVF